MRPHYNPVKVDAVKRVSTLISRIFKHLEKNQHFDFRNYGFSNFHQWLDFKSTLMNIDVSNEDRFIKLLEMYFATLIDDFCTDYKQAIYEMFTSTHPKK